MAERDLVDDARAAFFARLREMTPARIGLARTGDSIGTQDHLALQVAHAFARDAVHEALDLDALTDALSTLCLPVVHIASEAKDRPTYLARPDLGRQLDGSSRERLRSSVLSCDIAFVIADGLSACAAASHAVPMLRHLLPRLSGRTAALVVAEQARVAIGDEVGALLEAKLACVLIGERPGLSSPDSLGIYLTFGPRIGRTDAERNCLSNIRPAGLDYAEAARRCAWLINAAFAKSATGVALKDESGRPMLR